jgi:hypothetical protein
VLGRRNCRQCIELVVFAEQIPFNARDLQTAAQDVERMRFAACTQRPRLFLASAESRHLAPAALGNDTLQRLVAGIDDQPTLGGNGSHQVVKLALDCRQVIKDVGVVELEVVQDRGARPVMNELAALVEEGGVVFIGFDHERRCAAAGQLHGRVAQSSRHAKVQRHAANQESRRQAGLIEDEREHRRCGRLAMGARDRQHVPVVQHVVRQPLRSACVGLVRVEQCLEKRVASRDYVADHEQIRPERELVGAVALDDLNPECAKLVAHGRVDVLVAARDLVPAGARQHRQASHEGAADTEDVQVHRLPQRLRLARAASSVAWISAALCAALTKPASYSAGAK